MRPLHALLLVAGLAAAPASAAPSPPTDPSTTPPEVETFEWSSITAPGRLGVMVMALTPELRSFYGATRDRGVLVARIQPKSAAAAAGIEIGDVLVEVRGQPIDDATDVLAALATVTKGEAVPVTVIRDRKPVVLHPRLDSEPSASRVLPRPLPDMDWMWKWFREPPHEPSPRT